MKSRSSELDEEKRKNNQSRFDSLYNQYRSSVFAFAFSLTHNQRDAEDLFQETWLRIVENLAKILDMQNFKAWLFKVMANLYRDALRKKRIRQLFFLHRSELSFGGSQASISVAACEKLDITNDAEHMEINKAINKAIARLPDRQRRVFVLRELEEFKYSEISEILSVPLGTVKSLMHRAVKHLRRELLVYNPEYLEKVK